jgi:hypothetical protein
VRKAVALLLGAGVVLSSSRADAYRPFDGTDADTAELGEFELEFGPAHFYRQGEQNYVIAPATVLNFGLLPLTELVIDFKDYIALGPLQPGVPRAALQDTDVFVKHTFREGILQGKTGISIAAELGPLTPEINGTNAFGASLNVIFSYRWDWGTLHFNENPMFSREHDFEIFSSVIAEGPHEWVVRPVAEAYYDRNFNVYETESLLVGAIWTLKDSFVLDLGLRGARVSGENAAEVRLGFTWAIPMWEKTENAARAAPRRGWL